MYWMKRGLLPRKGAPETFDVCGFISLASRLRDEPEVIFPTFDRDRDVAIAGAGVIGEACDTVIVEGNYLLYDAPLWRDLRRQWDLSLQLDVPLPILKERLVGRWLAHGLTRYQAEKRAAENDLVNAKLIAAHCLSSDILLDNHSSRLMQT
jgi:pantothenate kinase